jgi:tetratricopeptide (TPR) repeat protein
VLFRSKDEGQKDLLYAEKIFKRIAELGGKDAFDEELIYLRAFNLEKIKEYGEAKEIYLDLVKRFAQSKYADTANYKLGIIYTYILGELKDGRAYFEKLSQKEPLSPQVISSLYQLGLFSQWEADNQKAKEYYQKLIEKAKGGFKESINLAKERLSEIEENKTLAYNLKAFLDAALKEGHDRFEMTKLDLKSSLYNPKTNQAINISSTAHTGESGCLQVTLQYLWSGDLGIAAPTNEQPAFITQYSDPGTKEINLLVVSPTGIIDRNLDLVDAH